MKTIIVPLLVSVMILMGCYPELSITDEDTQDLSTQGVYGSKLATNTLTIPDGTTSIKAADYKNKQFSVIIIPDSVTSIENGTFTSSTKLNDVTLPRVLFEKLETADRLHKVFGRGSVSPVNGAYSSEGIRYHRRVVFAKGILVDSSGDDNGDIPNAILIINDGVTSIDDREFWRSHINAWVSTLVLPTSLTTIGRYAFRGNGIASLVIPDSVTSIGDQAFISTYLKTVTLSKSLYDKLVKENRLHKVFGNRNIRYNFVEVVKNGTIFNSYDGYSLTRKLVINDGVLLVSSREFQSQKLTSVVIPDSVISIGDEAFADNNIKQIVIVKSIITINEHSFKDNKLTSIFIPSSVQLIHKGAFAGNNLSQVRIEGSSLKAIGDKAFGTGKDITVYVLKTFYDSKRTMITNAFKGYSNPTYVMIKN